jgi:hypothetical protein
MFFFLTFCAKSANKKVKKFIKVIITIKTTCYILIELITHKLSRENETRVLL